MNSTKIQFKKALELIQSARKILLTTHEGTDGDDLGSALALYGYLSQIGKPAEIVISGGVPANLSFLPGSNVVTEELSDPQFDLVVTFGCNKLERTGLRILQGNRQRIVNFDHHPDNTNFGTVNVVDADTSAVAELIYYFLKFADSDITKEI